MKTFKLYYEEKQSGYTSLLGLIETLNSGLVAAPKSKKEQIKYDSNYRLENRVKEVYKDELIFLPEPIVFKPQGNSRLKMYDDTKTITFLHAYKPIGKMMEGTKRRIAIGTQPFWAEPLEPFQKLPIIDGEPCYAFMRINNREDKKIVKYGVYGVSWCYPGIEGSQKYGEKMGISNLTDYVNFPFNIECKVPYDLVGDNTVEAICQSHAKSMRLLNLFNELTTQKGNKGYYEFFFETQEIQNMILDAPTHHYPSRGEYRERVLRGLLQAGLLKPEEIGDGDMIGML